MPRKKQRSHSSRIFLYPWLALRHAVLWTWRLPAWVKILKITAILVVVGSVLLWNRLEHWRQRGEIYDRLYPYYYSHYVKTLPGYKAKYYADFYAGYYADYYSSSTYKRALQFALPEASDKAFKYPAGSPVALLHVNRDGIEIIKRFEGFQPKGYLDKGGKLTIGYGHLIRPNEIFSTLGKSDAEKLLIKDVRLAEAVVKRNVKTKLTETQFSAVVSLVYNIGSGHFEDSTLLDTINERKFTAASREFLRWNYVAGDEVDGLTARRKAERELFLR